MRILVTGGGGYVGSVLVGQLLERGYTVRVLDNLMFRQTSLLPFFSHKNFDFTHGDIRDAHTLKEALRGVDFIVHLAAIVGAPICNADPALAESVNYEGTVLIDSLRSSEQPIIFASTGSNYGAVDGVCTEETELRPLSVYGVTKTKAEQHLVNSGNMIGYRFATAFGISPRLRLDLLPNDFVFQALRTGNLIVYEKHVRRTFIHVVDMARAIIHAIENYDTMKNNIYNVGNETLNATKEDVARLVQSKISFYLHFAEIDSDPDKRDYEVSYEKIRKTGFETSITLEEGINEMIKGFRLISLDNPFKNSNFS